MRPGRQALHDRIHFLLLVAYAASLPFFLHLGNYILGALLLNWLIEGNFRQKLSLAASCTPARLLAGFLLLFALSLLYSGNLSAGLSDIERKLGLLAIPLLIFSKSPPSTFQFRSVLLGFAISSVVGTTVALVIALAKYQASGDVSLFFYHQLSYNIGMHAVYLSCYLCFAIFIFIEYFRGAPVTWTWFRRVLALLLFVYILVLLVLLASKTMLVAFAIVLSVYLLLISASGSIRRHVSVVLALNAGLVLAVLLTPYTRQRFENAIFTNTEVLQQERFTYDSEFTGLSIRLLFWKITTEILSEEKAWVQGVGTGDSQDKLVERYKRYNLYGGDGIHDTGYMHYNTHSLFFEVLLRIGLVGLLYLIVLLAYPVYKSIRKKHMLLLAWVLLFSLFSLTEATMQLNKGVVFFSFFYSILLHVPLRNQDGRAPITRLY